MRPRDLKERLIIKLSKEMRNKTISTNHDALPEFATVGLRPSAAGTAMAALKF